MAFFTWFSITRHITIPAFSYGILTLAVIFSIIMENTKAAMHIHVDDEGIKLPASVRLRFVAWPQIEKVLLRYGVLTIDCADNKLLQLDVAQPTFSAESFEQYCDEKVEEGKKKRAEEW
jgi:hypothetical protein